MQKYLTVVSAVLSDAKRNEIIEKNPARMIDLPDAERKAQEIPTMEEMQKFLSALCYISITAVGKNEHGTRRATVLFVLNYGRHEQYGKIEGTYFWTKGVRNARKRVNEELEKILTQKLKERGLL